MEQESSPGFRRRQIDLIDKLRSSLQSMQAYISNQMLTDCIYQSLRVVEARWMSESVLSWKDQTYSFMKWIGRETFKGFKRWIATKGNAIEKKRTMIEGKTVQLEGESFTQAISERNWRTEKGKEVAMVKSRRIKTRALSVLQRNTLLEQTQ